MPSRKNKKLQSSKRRKRNKKGHKLPHSRDSLEDAVDTESNRSKVSAAPTAPSTLLDGTGAGVASKSTHKDQYSNNWKSLAKQLGMSTVRKGEKQVESSKTARYTPSAKSGRSRGQFSKGSYQHVSSNARTPEVQHMQQSQQVTVRKRERGASNEDDITEEPAAKRGKSMNESPLIAGTDMSVGKCVSLDCEMVGTGPNGGFSMLARCSIVNHHGNVLYDSHVAPMDTVTDYRTPYSGIRRRDLIGAPDLKSVQSAVSDIINGRILVGHGLQHDLKVLFLSHPKSDIRDTSKYKPFRRISNGGTPSLSKLCKEILGVEIQRKEHDSVEDSRAAMRLYQLHKKDWESTLRARHKKKNDVLKNL